MEFDNHDFENQLERELEDFMGQPLPDDGDESVMDHESDKTAGHRDTGGQKKRKRIKIVVIAALTVLLGVLGAYGGFAYYYSDKFFQGTTVNHIECGGLTVAQTEKLIREQAEKYKLEVNFQNDGKQVVKGSDIDYEYVSDGNVEKLQKSQNALAWVKVLWGSKKDYKIESNIKFSQDKLERIVAAMDQMQDAGMEEPVDAKLEFVDSKFQVTPEVSGSKLDKSKVLNGIQSAVAQGEEKVSVEELGAYIRPQVKKEDDTLDGQIRQLNELAGSSITYQLPAGDQVLDGNTLKDWLTVDADGSYSKDDTVWNQHIVDYVAAMAESVDTYEKDAKFNATNLGEITVKGKYGFQVNQEAEAAQLAKELANHTVAARKPNFVHEALSYENNGFGNSYVEIDLSRQHVWVYKDGALAVETGCVSGRMTADRWTPPGIFTLTFKKSPSVLRGPQKADGSYEWESPVTYWMPFNGGIGLHDATWRGSSQFGTNIYKSSGSHGCINLPPKKAEAIYNMIDQNMPIICYYSEPYSVGASTKKSAPSPTPKPTPKPTSAPEPTETPSTPEPTPAPTEEPSDGGGEAEPSSD